MSEHVLVTGGLGFLGFHLVNDLVRMGYQVVIQDIVPRATALAVLSEYKGQVTYIWKNTTDFREEDLHKIDYVVHLAGQADVPFSINSPLYTWYANTIISLTLLEAIRRNPHIKAIFPSTDNVYGAVPPERLPISEDEPINPTNQYAASKGAMEIAVRGYANQFGLNLIILRLSGFFGERGRPNQVVQIFIEKALKGEPISIEGDGSQTRDLNYVKNVSYGIVSALRSDTKMGTYNIGGGREVAIKELAELVVKNIDSNSKIEFRPWRLGEKGTRYHLDISRAKKEINYVVKYPLEEGIKRTVEHTKLHFKENYEGR